MCLQMCPQIASLRLCIETSFAFVWFFSTVRFQMFTQRAWVSTDKVTQSAYFKLSDSPQNAVMWGCKITQGCSTASPSPTRRGQPSPERCAPPSPPTYTSSSPCHSNLAMYMGRLCSLYKLRCCEMRT